MTSAVMWFALAIDGVTRWTQVIGGAARILSAHSRSQLLSPVRLVAVAVSGVAPPLLRCARALFPTL